MSPSAHPTLLRLVLRQGCVFYIQDRQLLSPEPHYFVVLNLAPLADHCLLLAVSSSQVEKVKRRRAGLPPETLVDISPADYPEFTVPSIIDCNTVLEKDHASLSRELQQAPGIGRHDMPSHILTRIIAGVLTSPLVTGAHKELLRRTLTPL